MTKTSWFRAAAVALGLLYGAQAHAESTVWAKARDPNDADRALLKPYLAKAEGAADIDDEFTDEKDLVTNWTRVDDQKLGIDSCRKPENVKVVAGTLSLVTGPTDACRAPWATGYVRSKRNDFGFGYYLAAIKVTPISGINNAFWLVVSDPPTKPAFEIDVVEAHFPSRAHLTLHDWRSGHKSVGRWLRDMSFTDSEKQYGALWLPDRIIYTIDGAPVMTIDATIQGQAEIRFSTAVMKWAGKLGGDPTGAAMVVDWVKFWK